MFTIRKIRLIKNSVSILITLLFVFSNYIIPSLQPNHQPGFPSPTHAAYKEFTQDDWAGGVDAGPHVVNWTSDNWNKYSSASNVDVSAGVIQSTTNNASLTSSILDLGSTERISQPFPSYDGDGTSLSFRGANTSGGVSSAPWQNDLSGCILSYRYIQYKVDFTISGESFYNILFQTTGFSINGGVTDSSGNDIEGATVQVIENGITATNEQKTSKGGPYIGYNASWDYQNGDPTSYTVTASKSGFNSQTKTASYNVVNCTTWSTLNFTLSSVSSGSSGSESSSSSTSNSTTTTSEPSVSTSEFQGIVLPKIFTAKGSKTTDLSKIKDPKKVKGFTIHIPGKSKIVFTDILNLAGESTVAALKKLDKYLLMGKVGIVDLDSKTLKALNKKAAIAMEGLKFARVPDVLVDGKADVKKIVNNEKYDKKTGILTFDANHFTAFWAVPKLVIITTTASIIANPNADIIAAISDADAAVTGEFNGVKLAEMKPDENGEFTIKKISLKEGGNLLKLAAESSLGKVLALETNISYNPNGKIDQQKPIYQEAAFLYTALSAIVIALVLGYLVYRRRKRHEKSSKTKTPASPKLGDNPPVST